LLLTIFISIALAHYVAIVIVSSLQEKEFSWNAYTAGLHDQNKTNQTIKWSKSMQYNYKSNDQNKSGFFGGPTFFQPIRAFWKLIRLLWLAG